MTDEILNSGPGPAGERMRVFISFAEGEEEFADYLGYVLALRGFEPMSSPAPRFRRRIIGKTEASVIVLTAAAAASKRVLGELGETVLQSKPALILVPGALGDDVAIPAAFAGHPQIHSWRNPDVAGSSLVNGLLALENALDAARLAPRPEQAVAETPEQPNPEPAETIADPVTAASEPVPQETTLPPTEEPAAEEPAFTIEALTTAFAETIAQPETAQPVPEPAVTPETIAAELIAEPLLASAPTLEAQILVTVPQPEPQSEFFFESLDPQAEHNPALDPVFKVSLEPTYDILDLTIRAEETPLLNSRPAPALPPLAFPRLVSSQPAARVRPQPRPTLAKPPAQIAKGQGNARRRSVAHLAIVTASLMCAAANAPWLLSFISTARAAAAEEKARQPSAPSFKPAVTVRNSEPEAPEAAIAPAPAEAEVIQVIAPALEVIEPSQEPETPAAAAAPSAISARTEAEAPALTDAELAARLDHDDWLEARKIGNLAAFRSYIEKHADGVHYAEAMDRARRRIAELSTQPSSTLVYLTGPAFFRGLPTRDLDGLEAGAKGQDVYIIDRIATRREGDWFVFERGGAWPFLFVNTDEVEKAELEKAVQ